MLDLNELEQFVQFADNKTLSKTAEKMHISQPTLTRTMKSVEEKFGVELFVRGKNKIELNETGKKAVEYSRKLLQESEDAIKKIQEFDKSLKTISIESCAPAPLWVLLPQLSSKFPQNTISSKLNNVHDIVENVKLGKCDIGIIPYAYKEYEMNNHYNNLSDNEMENKDIKIIDKKYMEENLAVCVPDNHILAKKKTVTFENLNGYNCLLKDEIGFWTDMCRDKMPASKFLIQSDEFELEELIRTSTLFCFITDLAKLNSEIYTNRKAIPITDKEANVTYHLIYRSDKK